MTVQASQMLEFWPGDMASSYMISGSVSALVGVADILNRYNENPLVALKTKAAFWYIVANASFGIAAFWIAMILEVVKVSGVTSHGGGLTVDSVRNALLVGFGATLILRSVAFKIAVGAKSGDAPSPSTIVDALLATFDQSIDRTVAGRKDQDVRAMMSGISFDKSKAFIPAYCLSLLKQDEKMAENVSGLVKKIGAFGAPDRDGDAQRAFLLGNALINVFGHEVASAAVKGFKKDLLISTETGGGAPPPSSRPLPVGAAPLGTPAATVPAPASGAMPAGEVPAPSVHAQTPAPDDDKTDTL